MADKPLALKAAAVRVPAPVQPIVLQPAELPSQPQPAVYVHVATGQPGNPLATAGLVLGILAALVCWVPFLGLVALPVGILGLGLATVGLVLSFRNRAGLAVAVVALMLCLGAMGGSYLVTLKTAGALSTAFDSQKIPYLAGQEAERRGQQDAAVELYRKAFMDNPRSEIGQKADQRLKVLLAARK